MARFLSILNFPNQTCLSSWGTFIRYTKVKRHTRADTLAKAYSSRSSVCLKAASTTFKPLQRQFNEYSLLKTFTLACNLKRKKFRILNLRQNWGRGLVDRKLVEAPSIFIAGRPKAALLFWFLGDFRCGVLLFMVILVVYNYQNR